MFSLLYTKTVPPQPVLRIPSQVQDGAFVLVGFQEIPADSV